jgi:hypothetical protein
MKRGFLLLFPLALGAIAFAQDKQEETDDAQALVKKLGSEDYAVREEAQKQLIAMGEKALPALEEGLKSDDLEVRLRSGRALRAIRGERAEARKPAEGDGSAKDQAAPASDVRSMSLSVQRGKVVVTVTRMVDGKEETKTYEAATIDELKEKHPELKAQLDGRFQFRFGNRDDFDMDSFWKDWNKEFGSIDEDMRRWQEDTRRWLELWRNQQGRRPELGMAMGGPMLGVRAARPTPVLDAQLELRGKGLVIDAVEKDSLADRLGLQRFDVLTELNGREVKGVEDVAHAVRAMKPEDKATAKVVRRAQTIALAEADVGSPK